MATRYFAGDGFLLRTKTGLVWPVWEVYRGKGKWERYTNTEEDNPLNRTSEVSEKEAKALMAEEDAAAGK